MVITSDLHHYANINVQLNSEIKPIDKKHQKVIFDSVLKDMELKNFSFSREDIIQNVLNTGLESRIQLEDVNKLINQSKRLRKAIDKNGNEVFISKANEKCEQDLLDLLEQSKGNGIHIDSIDADRLLHKVVTEKNLTPNEEKVNFSTVAMPLKLEGEAIYEASKAAIVSLTETLAREYSDFGITVNAVGPTPIQTDLVRSVPQEKMG